MTHILNHEPGWCGGKWTLDGKEIGYPEKLYTTIDGKEYKVYCKSRHGSDYDHGHSYTWSNIDFYIETKVPGIKKPVQVMLREQRILPIKVSIK